MDLSFLAACYETLELPFGAPPEDVTRAYRQWAMVWHPDRLPSDTRLQQKATEKMQEINRAYHEIQVHQSALADHLRTQREKEHRERVAQTERERQERMRRLEEELREQVAEAVWREAEATRKLEEQIRHDIEVRSFGKAFGVLWSQLWITICTSGIMTLFLAVGGAVISYRQLECYFAGSRESVPWQLVRLWKSLVIVSIPTVAVLTVVAMGVLVPAVGLWTTVATLGIALGSVAMDEVR